jgi:hypothetical protein
VSKLYLLAGGALLVGYLAIETRGMVFSGTDSKPSLYSGGGGSGGRGGGGVIFWGSGYRGGK